MRKYAWLACAVSLLLALPAGANLLNNPSFETGDFTGWSTFGQGWRISSWPGDQYHGTYGAVDDVLPGHVDEWRGLFQNIAATPGVQYTLSGYIRAVGVSRTASWLEIQFLDSGNNVLAQHQSTWVTADQPFTYTSVSGTAPANTVALSARAIVNMPAPVSSSEFHIFDQMQVVPEPSTVGLALAGIGALFYRVRRARR